MSVSCSETPKTDADQQKTDFVRTKQKTIINAGGKLTVGPELEVKPVIFLLHHFVRMLISFLASWYIHDMLAYCIKKINLSH